MRFVRHLCSVLAALALSTLVLAGCGDDDEVGAAGGAGDGTASAGEDDESVDEDDDTPIETTTTTAPTTTTTEPPSAQGAECLVGTWISDNQAFGEAFEAMAPPEAAMTVDSITGVARFEVGADGTASTTYEDWTINVSITSPAPGSATITRRGVDTGTYTAGDDGSFAMVENTSNSTVEASATVNGQTMAMPSTEGVQTDLVGGEGTYGCEGDRLQIEVEGATVFFDRAG